MASRADNWQYQSQTAISCLTRICSRRTQHPSAMPKALHSRSPIAYRTSSSSSSRFDWGKFISMIIGNVNANREAIIQIAVLEDYRKFGLKPRRFTTALSYNGKSDNQAKN